MLQGTGWVDCSLLLSTYRSHLLSSSQLRECLFDYDRLNTSDQKLRYDDIKAHKIVFTEGTGMMKNPWFSYLPLRRTKGELLVIHCHDLKERNILHSGIFIRNFSKCHCHVFLELGLAKLSLSFLMIFGGQASTNSYMTIYISARLSCPLQWSYFNNYDAV